MIHVFFAATVAIVNFAFAPAHVTVATGDSVRFVNRDGEAHTVTAQGGSFNSGGIDTGGTWVHRFGKIGTYTYFCQLHPYMTGSIIVVKRAVRRP